MSNATKPEEVKEEVKEDVQVPAEDAAATQGAVRKAEEATMRQLKKQKRLWLTINSTEKDSTAVMVGVNGYAYRIKRDKPCLVPEAVVNVLRLATYDSPIVERGPNGIERTTFRHVNRYSFSVEPESARKAEDD